MADRVAEASDRKVIEQEHLRVALHRKGANGPIVASYRHVGYQSRGIGDSHLARSISTHDKNIIGRDELTARDRGDPGAGPKSGAVITDVALGKQRHGAPAQVELAGADIADLEPIVGGPGNDGQLTAADRKLAVGIIAHRYESKRSVPTRDIHLAEAALADVGDIVGRDHLTGGDRDRA